MADNHVEGKVVIVTGAGGGFGRLVAGLAAERGAKVVGADVSADALKSLAEELQERGLDFEPFLADVSDKAEVDALADRAIERFGRIDVMVNNAGIMPLAFYADHRDAWQAWHRCIDVNVKGVLNGIGAVYDQMIEQGRGHVVNISSIYGNFPTAGAGVYGATKAAVNALSEALRVESQGKIKVTLVRPTGVLGTGLGATVVNPAAVVGIVGQHAERFGERVQQFVTGALPGELTDEDSAAYWAMDPRHLAEAILYVIDQPWGVSIGDITVRATGEDYVL